MKSFRLYTLWMLLPLMVSCSKSDDNDHLPDRSNREVRLILSMNGLGDRAFSDDIMRGVLQAQKEFAFTFHYYIPENPEDAEKKIKEWNQHSHAVRSLTILGSNEYEEIAVRMNGNDKHHLFLQIEASSAEFDIPVFRFSGYGVSFLTGIAAYVYTRGDTAAYLGGQRNHAYLEECRIGFRDGYRYAGGQEVTAVYLSEEPDGFAMAQPAYQCADSLYRQYSFIYPVAGGSNDGVYRWLRNHPGQNKFTAGVDVDQSAYSNHLIGSMIKEIGRALYDYIGLWMEEKEWPEWNLFDLQSGYTYFLVSEAFRKDLQEVIDTYKSVAIEKESEYNKGKDE